MKKIMQQLVLAALSMVTLSYGTMASAHEVTLVTMDADGTVPGFTGYAQIGCFDDGNGPPDHFVVQIKDHSPPQDNLLLSAQIIGKKNAANTTDPISGDNESSPEIEISEGAGPYLVLVNKSGPGERVFTLTYHCHTANHVHTGTNEPNVLQFQ
ncbi:MAG TPA: hypothetical protein VK141_01885 [Nitrosomonas sp.]|nr:hypothetical protein [Nitrosomonas sp.]